MIGIDKWESPMDPVDETTGEREKIAALERVETAEQGVQRTHDAVSTLRRHVGEIRELHTRNHYVDKLVLIYRGTPRHA